MYCDIVNTSSKGRTGGCFFNIQKLTKPAVDACHSACMSSWTVRYRNVPTFPKTSLKIFTPA